MNCPYCGCALHSDTRFCPNCGAALNRTPSQSVAAATSAQNNCSAGGPVYAPPTPPPPEPAQGLAKASQICGILSVVLFCCMFFPLPIAAIVTGVLARQQGNRSGKAKAGIICGIVAVVLAALMMVLAVIYAQTVDLSNQYYW